LYISQGGFRAVSADIVGENVGVVSAIMNRATARRSLFGFSHSLDCRPQWLGGSFVTATSIAAFAKAGRLIIGPNKVCGEAGTDSMMTHPKILRFHQPSDLNPPAFPATQFPYAAPRNACFLTSSTPS
jgi:hypothetical protein